MVCCAFGFLLPIVLGLGNTAGLVCIVLIMGILLALEVGVEIWAEGKLHGWDFQAPKLQVDWHNFATEGGKRAMNFVGAEVSSHEQFFTVLVAVSVFSINVAFVQKQDPWTYILTFAIFYGVLEASLTYSSRFSVEDATHKLKWTAYEIIFLLMLEGLTMDASGDSKLFKVTTAAMFFLMAIAFFGRVASTVPRARKFGAYYAVFYVLVGCLHAARCFFPDLGAPLLWIYAGLWVMATPYLHLLLMPREDGSDEAARALAAFDVPANVDYIISRFNGLFMEILTVSIIVPNAFYPGHPEQNLAGRRAEESEDEIPYKSLVFWADFLVALLAIVLKFAIFDIQPVDHDHHVFVSGDRAGEVLFLWLYPVTSLGTASTGAGMAMMIPSIGLDGFASTTVFAQRTLCFGAALTWLSLAATKKLHSPSDTVMSHNGQIYTQLAGALGVLLPLLVNMGDFAVLAFVVCMYIAVVVGQEVVMDVFKSDGDKVDSSTGSEGARIRAPSGKGRRFTLLAQNSIDGKAGGALELGAIEGHH